MAENTTEQNTLTSAFEQIETNAVNIARIVASYYTALRADDVDLITACQLTAQFQEGFLKMSLFKEKPKSDD